MIKHHPAPEQLIDYASGAMSLSHAFCVSAHLEYCEHCRRSLHQCTEIGTHYFSAVQNTSTEETDLQLKDKVLALLDEAQPVTIESADNDENFSLNLKELNHNNYDNLDWSRISPSIRLATLLNDKDGSQIALSRTRAGGKMPHHSHTGDEITVVLKGSFSDEDGLYSQGDFIFRSAKDKHSPIVTNDDECICLLVLDAPIQFTGFFTRWLNPLVRKHHAGD